MLDDDSLDFESDDLNDSRIYEGLTNRQTYNVVSDTVSGVNVRVKDNVIQAIAISVSILLGAGIGMFVAGDLITGLLAGGFIGMVAGLIFSGAAIMIYRGLNHMQGKHD